MKENLLVSLTSSDQKPVPAICVFDGDPKAFHQLECHFNVWNRDQFIDDLDFNVPESQRSCHKQGSQILTAYGSRKLNLQMGKPHFVIHCCTCTQILYHFRLRAFNESMCLFAFISSSLIIKLQR